jgi:hypothetical protein
MGLLRPPTADDLASLITHGGSGARLRGHVRWAVEHGVTAEPT